MALGAMEEMMPARPPACLMRLWPYCKLFTPRSRRRLNSLKVPRVPALTPRSAARRSKLVCTSLGRS